MSEIVADLEVKPAQPAALGWCQTVAALVLLLVQAHGGALHLPTDEYTNIWRQCPCPNCAAFASASAGAGGATATAAVGPAANPVAQVTEACNEAVQHAQVRGPILIFTPGRVSSEHCYRETNSAGPSIIILDSCLLGRRATAWRHKSPSWQPSRRWVRRKVP